MSAKLAPIEVFYCYAHEDEALCRELEKHLSLLHRQELISSWYDRQIVPGTDWAKTINTHLETASLILLLISSDFLASDYCYGREMKRALERHQAHQARVIPILMRPVNWCGAPFEHLEVLPTDARSVTEWDNLDAAFRDIATGIRRAIENLPQPSAIAPSVDLPSVWNIQYPRNAFFTGREQLLQRLAEALKAGQATALSQAQAISGLGGIGKTQIAVEYAYRYCQNYQTVLWVLADTRESLVSGYIAIAGLLNLPEKDAQEQQIIIQAVKAWLQTHGSWLLILDNADDLALVREFVPSVFGGHLLLTTRAQATGTLAHRIEVETMPQDVGALFLLRRAKLIAPSTKLTDVVPHDAKTAREITEELGGLPLALDQAGAYLEETQCSLVGYQQRYRKRQSKLLRRRGIQVVDHPEPVATTWSLSFEKVEQQSPVAADLLCVCTFLHPDAIPEEIIVEGARHLGPQLTLLAEDPAILDEALAVLSAYSLLRKQREENTLSIHRLVQAVLKDAMPVETAKQWKERILRAVYMSLPAMKHTSWSQWERVLSHVLVCASWTEQEELHLPEAAKVLQHAGLYLTDRARYSEAQPLLERAYQISQEVRGETHLDTVDVAITLAYLYKLQGKYTDAELLLRQSLIIREQQLGPEHPFISTALRSLASIYQLQGKYEEAEPLYMRALVILEQQLGSDHPDTARGLNNLAELYYEQGKYTEAEALYRRALTIREQQLGGDHPDTAASLNNLAGLYQTQGKYIEAEALYRRALTIREQQLGSDHPDTATSLDNLAGLYYEQGKYIEAEPMCRRALSIYKEQLRGDHPHIAKSLNNLAKLYSAQGKYTEAEPLYTRALAICMQQLGGDHPHTRLVRSNYTSLLRAIGRDEEAAAIEEGGHSSS